MQDRIYIAIDLKSFYASVECVERGLDPLNANLVVADSSRTSKTICLAVSPALKSFGVPGRPRLFEVEEKVRQINAIRKKSAPNGIFKGNSDFRDRLLSDPSLFLSFITAKPRMATYILFSDKIVDIYLKYVSREDMHVYSVDEVFIDATQYLKTYGLTAVDFAKKIVSDVISETGITATVGIGPNLFLCKVAMDIVAKKMPADKNGFRIAEINESSYRELLWDHRPITDFWRVGPGIASKLEKYGMLTMGDVALMSHYDEELLYRLFGINAELLIDHAWGWEPCSISDIRGYRPQNNSLSSGQVLTEPYPFEKALLVTKEMADLLAMDLFSKRIVTNQIVLTIGYDVSNLSNPDTAAQYDGKIKGDRYGRRVPEHSHGTENLEFQTSSSEIIVDAAERLFRRIVNPDLSVRRINIVANNIVTESAVLNDSLPLQTDLFTDYPELEKKAEESKNKRQKERNRQNALLEIRDKYGKNAIIKGMNLQEGATAVKRNKQIGGHNA